jgi:CDP-diacylglycerol--serine O-phosphatidyltransferase
MSLRVRERLSLADAVTLLNAVIGVVAMIAAITEGPAIAARLILLAAVADGLDGIIARSQGGSEVGPILDSIADVVSFGAAPAMFLFALVRETWGPLGTDPVLLAVAVAPAFVVLSVVRTALYTVYVGEDQKRPGIQNTLAASILTVGFLAAGTAVPAETAAIAVLGASPMLGLLMIAPIAYPKLTDRDALVMGVVQAAVIVRPDALERVFPRALLLVALAYMLLAPRFYWK